MQDKIVHHIAIDIWNHLQDVKVELEGLLKLGRGINKEVELDAKVALEHLTSARKLVALLTKEDYDVEKGD